MQARPLAWAGTRSSSEAGKAVVVHQQGVSNVPALAGAQALGPPHKGQRSFGRGMEDGSVMG